MIPADLIATLNDNQRAIACTLDRPLFVSAGAGSGKTFTLTRRIAWALSPGSGPDGAPFLDSLDQVLVITFTEAAAREIRERVRQTLREAGATDTRMREASLAVDRAWISTIHGMCSRILHRHALDLGLDPQFSVAGENVADELLYSAMVQVVGEARRDRRFRGLFDRYPMGGYNPGSLTSGYSGAMGLVKRALELGSRCPGGLDGLRVPEALAVSRAVAGVMEYLSQATDRYCACKLTASAQAAIAPLVEALASWSELSPGQQTPQVANELLEDIKLPRASKATAEERAELGNAFARARIEAALACGTADAEMAIELARRVKAAFDELKRQEATLTNDDLIELALVAVRDHPEVARDYTSRFRLVMVDEFQDTDERQLELISLLAGEGARHLCTVGDSQQSIYRFRGADVDVFRRHGMRVEEAGQVRLATNYRSHADVLSLVERICGGRPTPLAQLKEAVLGAGDSSESTGVQPLTEDVPDSVGTLRGGVLSDYMHLDPSPTRRDGFAGCAMPRVSIEAVTGPGSAGSTSAAQAAVLAVQMADRMAEYVAAGIEPGKIALLLGVTTHAELYIDAMRLRGLECVVTGGSTFTSSVEAEVMCALLHTLANPADTQSGLFRLLTSEVFELDANDLCLLGTRTNEVTGALEKRPIDQGLQEMSWAENQVPSARLRLAHEVLAAAWEDVRTLPVAEVCLRVVRDSGWLARLEAGGEQGLARAANVLAAVRYVRDLTSDLGLGPARAAVEFDRWLSLAKLPPGTLSGGATTAVRVMTIHASKGLEFPVVAVAECWRNAKSPSGLFGGPASGVDGASDQSAAGEWLTLVSPSDYGTLSKGLAEDDAPALKGSTLSLTDEFCALRYQLMEDDQAEKARLLYVALTRAEEALIVGIACPMGKDGISYTLAAGAMSALAEPGQTAFDLLVPGQRELDFGGEAPAALRVVEVNQRRGTKGEPRTAEIDSAGTLPAADGEWTFADQSELLVLGFEETVHAAVQAEAPSGATGRAAACAERCGSEDLSERAQLASSEAASLGVSCGCPTAPEGASAWTAGSPEPFILYAREQEPAVPLTTWRAREGVFSYSSAHRVLEAEGELVQPAPAAKPTPRERAAEVEGAPTAEDADKATNLGSAFHELAQMMVETDRELSDAQVDRMARYWHLSTRATARLHAAIDRWMRSDLRAEALTYDLLRAEVPFFIPSTPGLERFGQQMEGAIDLLCCNRIPAGASAPANTSVSGVSNSASAVAPAAFSPDVLLIDYKTGDIGLTADEICARHAMQADFYAAVLRSQGFERITCAFVCVELDSGLVAGTAPTSQPHVVRYEF